MIWEASSPKAVICVLKTGLFPHLMDCAITLAAGDRGPDFIWRHLTPDTLHLAALVQTCTGVTASSHNYFVQATVLQPLAQEFWWPNIFRDLNLDPAQVLGPMSTRATQPPVLLTPTALEYDRHCAHQMIGHLYDVFIILSIRLHIV
jgi:hypothetical protein